MKIKLPIDPWALGAALLIVIVGAVTVNITDGITWSIKQDVIDPELLVNTEDEQDRSGDGPIDMQDPGSVSRSDLYEDDNSWPENTQEWNLETSRFEKSKRLPSKHIPLKFSDSEFRDSAR